MIRRNAGLAALLAVTAYTQAEIAAPPAIGENPAPAAPAPSMEEHASAPAKASYPRAKKFPANPEWCAVRMLPTPAWWM